MRRVAVAVAASLTAALALSGCSSSTPSSPAAPAAVALAAPGVPTMTIGVIVTLSSPLGEGSDWSKAAEGAQVAAYRYKLGGSQITLKAVDDKGSPEGAVTAVDQLVQAGVSGIVLASEGTHVQAAVSEAAKSGTPVLLPYEMDPARVSGAAWLTGPTKDPVAAATAAAAGSAARTLVLNGGGGVPTTLTAPKVETVNADDAQSRIVSLIKKHVKNDGTDVVVVTGAAAVQAKVERAVQGANITLPVVLGPQATSPTFSSALAAKGGSLNGNFVSVGTNSGDIVALQADADGQAMSAFLAGVRGAAADSQLKDYFDGASFSLVAPLADSRSHDCVVALVAAASKAGNTKPADVAAALTGMPVTHSQGLAGPPLTFTAPSALAADAVVPLRASTRETGLRPSTNAVSDQLTWFEPSTG